MISSNVLCGIFSIFSSAAFKYISGANLKLPFAILTVRIFPANSYISEKRKACILERVSNVPESKANLNGDKYKEASSPDRNGFAMAVSIFSDGAVSGQALFPKSNKKSKIIPELFQEYNGTHYMFTRNGKKGKFAMFNPE